MFPLVYFPSILFHFLGFDCFLSLSLYLNIHDAKSGRYQSQSRDYITSTPKFHKNGAAASTSRVNQENQGIQAIQRSFISFRNDFDKIELKVNYIQKHFGATEAKKAVLELHECISQFQRQLNQRSSQKTA